MGRKAVDITGQRFGRLVAIEPTGEKSGNGGVIWKCRCDCGNYAEVNTGHLRSGSTNSCGCLLRNDISGKRFGRLLAVEPTGERKNEQVVWKCKCDCGNYIKVVVGRLNAGSTKSCGCLQSELAKERLSGEYGREARGKNSEKYCKEQTKLSQLTMKKSKANTSGVKGVYQNKNAKKWIAQIMFRGKSIYLGCFDNLEDATLARKEAEEKYFAPILEKYGFAEK